jgi:phosphoesterase RecJ-like protein
LNGKDAAVSFLREQSRFVITTHVFPDGDGLGSALALSLALEAMGKQCRVYCRDGVPDVYEFLPHSEKVLKKTPPADGAALVLLDCNKPERAAIEAEDFDSTAVIDHHETESDFGQVRWIEPRVPATGIMVYHALKALGAAITKDIATNLYAAIAVDTGTFRFSNTDPDSLRVAAELTEAGAEPGYISENLYQTWSENRFKLLCMNMGSLDVKGSVSLTTVTAEMFELTNTHIYDTENFVNFPLLMKDVKVSVFLRETEKNIWKVSLRSKGDINVAKLAERFHGGGHKNAAGCRVRGDLVTVRGKVLGAIRELYGL